MNDKEKKFQELIEKADHERVEKFISIFDRVLLYTIAAKLIPREAVDYSMQVWDKLIKKCIDLDASTRTKFLEETVAGRTAKFRHEIDGEDIRLHSLTQFEIAKTVIENNMHFHDEDDDFSSPVD